MINWLIDGKSFTLMFVIDTIGISVTVITIISAFFSTYFWRLRIFRKWLVLIPNLNGKWTGTIESDWINPETQERVASIPTELTIKQSLFKISCMMKTGEMKSTSINGGFNINPDNQEYQLLYTYMSVPKQYIQGHSPIHYGTMLFDMDKNYNVSKMFGNYWTGRKTGGFISVEKEQ